jgi:hypothetical protein
VLPTLSNVTAVGSVFKKNWSDGFCLGTEATTNEHMVVVKSTWLVLFQLVFIWSLSSTLQLQQCGLSNGHIIIKVFDGLDCRQSG